MAFRLPTTVENYEFRAIRTGNGRNGAWMSLVLESPEDADQIDVSVPRDMHGDIYNLGLKKGDKVTAKVVAFAGPEYSRITLESIVTVVDVNGEVVL